MIIQRIFGWISIIVGLSFIILFPSSWSRFTPPKFTHAAILIGIFLIGLGIFLVKA
jgi:hypothetical protein